MPKLSLMLETNNCNLQPEDTKKTPQEIASQLLKNIVLLFAQQIRGFNKGERKLYYTITDKLANSLKDSKTEVEFDDSEWGLIKRSFKEVKLEPNNVIRNLEELIEKAV